MRMTIRGARVPIMQMLFMGFLPSFLKIWIYRLKGAKFGRNVKIGIGSIIAADQIEIDDDTSISFGTFIRGREVKIGRRVEIGALFAIDVEKLHIDDDAKGRAAPRSVSLQRYDRRRRRAVGVGQSRAGRAAAGTGQWVRPHAACP